MDTIKINFNFKDEKSELNFQKDDLILNIFSSFATKINKNIENLNFLYSGEKLTNYENKKLCELNSKDNIINISVYEKKELNDNPSNKLGLKISEHIICPKCKNFSEIDISNFKILLKNCDNNHSMPGLFMNDFITTQYIDDSKILCNECKKSGKDIEEKDNIKLLMCSCGKIVCQGCFENHKNKEENHSLNHYNINYNDKNYFCFKHNEMYTSYCQNCKKNICNKCEEEHNKHLIENYKKISPKDSLIEKIKNMNEQLISKIKKFNRELNELINLLNNIANNIQNDLKIFLQISNKVIKDYNDTKKNYQTIQNLKVIHNNLNENPIFQNIETFLSDTNSNNRIKCLLEMYNMMYLESSNNIIEQEHNKEDAKKEEKKIESKTDKDINLEQKDPNSYIVLKYLPDMKAIKDNKIKLFGKKFYENNKYNCYMVINDKEYFFSEYYTLKKSDLKNNELEVKLYQSNPMTNISYMFSSDENEDPIFLSEIPLINNLDTSKIISMNHLFCNCTELKSINGISNWDLSKITNLSSLFYRCKNLISIPDISKWKLDNVENISYIFYSCEKIVSLPDISSWNTKKITDMRGVFSNCKSLKSIPDISKWNTENVTNMNSLFRNCNNLETLPDISTWDIGKVCNMGGMFCHCSALQNLPDISKWNTKSVKNMNHLFYYCTNLNSIPDISIWNIENVIDIKGFFCDCCSLSILPDLSKWNTKNVNNMSCMFFNCKELLSLPDLLEWDINKVENIKNMFTNCIKLPEQVIPRKFKL